MKRLFLIMLSAAATFFQACGSSPTRNDVVGGWSNSDGARLDLNENGEFLASSLPAGVFVRSLPKDQLISGKGRWKFEKGKPYWEVRLWFGEISGKPANREIPLLVSGSGSRVYLYQWIGEEGGARYKLNRN
jgi:hypothetical protein